MKCSIMLHFIWNFTVCQSTRLRLPVYKGFKTNTKFLFPIRMKINPFHILVNLIVYMRHRSTSAYMFVRRVKLL